MKYIYLSLLILVFGIIVGVAIRVIKYGDILYTTRINYIYLYNDEILIFNPCSEESVLMYLEDMDYDKAKKIKYVYCFADDIYYRVECVDKKFDLIKIYDTDEENNG